MLQKNLSVRPQAVLSRRLAVAGLFELLKIRPYAQISISDICAQGGISRQTFYRNFTEKEDIILYYIQHLLRRYIDSAEGEMEKDLKHFFFQLPLTPEILKLLHENNLMYLVRDSMLPLIGGFMETEQFHTEIQGEMFRNYYARYIADTMMSILETWTLNDFKESHEVLFDMMRVFLSGMNASTQTLN